MAGGRAGGVKDSVLLTTAFQLRAPFLCDSCLGFLMNFLVMGEKASSIQEIRLHMYTLQRRSLISSLHPLTCGFRNRHMYMLGCTYRAPPRPSIMEVSRASLIAGSPSSDQKAQGLPASALSKGLLHKTPGSFLELPRPGEGQG